MSDASPHHSSAWAPTIPASEMSTTFLTFPLHATEVQWGSEGERLMQRELAVSLKGSSLSSNHPTVMTDFHAWTQDSPQLEEELPANGNAETP